MINRIGYILIAALLLLLVIACASTAWSGALDLHLGDTPEQRARADTLRQMGAQATAQALVIAKARADQDLALKQRWNDWWFAFLTIAIPLTFAAALLTAGALAAALAYRHLQRAARLIPVAPNLTLTPTPSGPLLIDHLTAQLLAPGQQPAPAHLQRAAIEASIQIAAHLPPPLPAERTTTAIQPTEIIPAPGQSPD